MKRKQWSGNLLFIPQMLLLGSTGRNSGKTTLATALIGHWKTKYPIIGLKVTTIHESHGRCPRGGEGCGVCSSMAGDYELLEEKNENANKDTSLMLYAGAEKVYWIKTKGTHTYEAIKEFMERIPKDALIICESNSLRRVIKPGSFIMLRNTDLSAIKNSAAEVMGDADTIIDFNINNGIKDIVQRIKIEKGINGLSMNYIKA